MQWEADVEVNPGLLYFNGLGHTSAEGGIAAVGCVVSFEVIMGKTRRGDLRRCAVVGPGVVYTLRN